MSSAGDGFTSVDRNILRGVLAYEDRAASVNDIISATGYTRMTVRSGIRLLEKAGLIARRQGEFLYVLTEAGRAELAANKKMFLVVEVDDRLAEDISYYLARSVNGITAVTEHGPGCCCKNCPWGGNHG